MIKLSWFVVVTATCKDTGSVSNGQNTSDFEVRTTRTTPTTARAKAPSGHIFKSNRAMFELYVGNLDYATTGMAYSSQLPFV
jgi:hypothetical protein